MWLDYPTNETVYEIHYKNSTEPTIFLTSFTIKMTAPVLAAEGDECSETADCQNDLFCFEGFCDYCNQPFLFMQTHPATCVWHCGEGTQPDIILRTCVCQEGYISAGYDAYDRLVCEIEETTTYVFENDPCDQDLFICSYDLECQQNICVNTTINTTTNETVNVTENITLTEPTTHSLEFNVPTVVLKNSTFNVQANYYRSTLPVSTDNHEHFFIVSDSGIFFDPYIRSETSPLNSFLLWEIPILTTTAYELYVESFSLTDNTSTKQLLQTFEVKTTQNEEEVIEEQQKNESEVINLVEETKPIDTKEILEDPKELMTKKEREYSFQARNTVLEEKLAGFKEEKIFSKINVSLEQPQIPSQLREYQKQQEQVNLIVQKRDKQDSGEVIRRQEKAKETFTIQKEITVKEVTTKDDEKFIATEIKIRVQPKENETTIDVVEVISKEVAQHVSELAFSRAPIILEDDPVIMWHLEDVHEPVELTYTVAKNTSLTGNTILLAESEQSFDWEILLPLLFIPLLAIIIVFFNHFHNKEE